MKTDIILTVKNRAKALPYIAENRTDGTVNHGFRLLKGRKEDVMLIPEACDSNALQYALTIINDSSTAFITVGCEKDLNNSPQGFWQRGYIEFAFNNPAAVGNAGHYFNIFHEFNKEIWESGFDRPLQYQFELEGAEFRESILEAIPLQSG